jgi:hypothetical protein
LTIETSPESISSCRARSPAAPGRREEHVEGTVALRRNLDALRLAGRIEVRRVQHERQPEREWPALLVALEVERELLRADALGSSGERVVGGQDRPQSAGVGRADERDDLGCLPDLDTRGNGGVEDAILRDGLALGSATGTGGGQRGSPLLEGVQ